MELKSSSASHYGHRVSAEWYIYATLSILAFWLNYLWTVTHLSEQPHCSHPSPHFCIEAGIWLVRPVALISSSTVSDAAGVSGVGFSPKGRRWSHLEPRWFSGMEADGGKAAGVIACWVTEGGKTHFPSSRRFTMHDGRLSDKLRAPCRPLRLNSAKINKRR